MDEIENQINSGQHTGRWVQRPFLHFQKVHYVHLVDVLTSDEILGHKTQVGDSQRLREWMYFLNGSHLVWGCSHLRREIIFNYLLALLAQEITRETTQRKARVVQKELLGQDTRRSWEMGLEEAREASILPPIDHNPVSGVTRFWKSTVHWGLCGHVS